jgi:hypothetical protein
MSHVYECSCNVILPVETRRTSTITHRTLRVRCRYLSQIALLTCDTTLLGLLHMFVCSMEDLAPCLISDFSHEMSPRFCFFLIYFVFTAAALLEHRL